MMATCKTYPIDARRLFLGIDVESIVAGIMTPNGADLDRAAVLKKAGAQAFMELQAVPEHVLSALDRQSRTKPRHVQDKSQ